VCGDGVVNASCGEQCDDGNALSCDGCSATCQTELGPRCGDGIVNATCGEQCDDGNLIDGDGCDSNCTLTACGNGIVTAGEECEDGNRDPLDGCTNACTICGNGIVTPPEQCDDGAAGLSDDCTPACTRCGNVDGSEACADGNSVGGDGCAANCTIESTRKVRLDASSSVIAFQSSYFSLSRLPISGQLTLQVGRARETAEGIETPLAVRAGELRTRFPVLGQCFCLVAVEDPALGDGIAGRGTLSCAEPLVGVDIVSSVDHNTNDVDPACERGFLEDGSYYPNFHPHRGVCNGAQTITASGTGPSGSARLDLRMGSYPFPGTCEVETSTQVCDARGCLPAKGADGIPCTEDDPLPDTSIASPLVSRTALIQRSGAIYRLLPSLFDLRLTTGKAEAEIRDAEGEPGRVIGKGADCGGGPCVSEASGTALDCSALGQAQGNDLVSGAFAAAFPALDSPDLGDMVTTLRIGPALCTGDCNRDDSVTIDELLKGANMALGATPAGDCPSFDTNGDDRVTIEELIAAVNKALNGCEP
jgi:cysteine-rich repeat protein